MEREKLIEDLRRVTGGSAWISKRKLRTWLGMGDEKEKEFIRGLASRINGNRIEFFICDVADRVLEGIYETV